MSSMLESFEKFCDRLSLLSQRGGVVIASVILLIVWRLLPHSPADPDLFARLAMGRLVQTTGSVPLQDPFAFTEKLPEWIDHEWLSGVFFLWLVQAWGDLGLIISKVLFALFSAFFILKASKLHSPSARGRIVWIALCLLHASYLWGSTLRCQAFTYLFLSYLFFAFAHFQVRRCSRYLWVMPVISVPWVNLHGGWALGLVTLGLFTATRLLRRQSFIEPLLITALCGAAIFVTPYAPRTFAAFLFGALGMQRTSISEWAPLSNDTDQLVATSIFLFVMFAGFLQRGSKRDLSNLVVLCFSAYCGFRHTRLLGFFMLCSAVYGPEALSALLTRLATTAPALTLQLRRAMVIVITAILMWMSLDLSRSITRPGALTLDMSEYPTGAVQFLASSGEHGRLLVDFNNGSFAIWKLYPHFLISLDGRYEEVYPESTMREVSEALLFETSSGKRSLEKIDPTHVLTRSEYLHIVGVPSSDWSVTFDDGSWAVLRKGPPLERHPVPLKAGSALWQPMF